MTTSTSTQLRPGPLAGRYPGASHVRANIHPHTRDRTGRLWWSVHVVNTSTGVTLVSTDALSLDDAMDTAAEIVTAVRAAWFWGICKHDLAHRPRHLHLKRAEIVDVVTALTGTIPDGAERLVARLSAALAR